MLLLLVLILPLTFVTCNASFVTTACATELATITCHNDSKIFIESVSYGRTDNVTCLAPNQEIPSCNVSIDLSWRVLPYCQGLSSCVVNGSYDGTVVPCDGNGTNYFNISYNCKTINETEFPENTFASFVCPIGEIFVIHKLEWRGLEYILKNRTILPNSTNALFTASTNNQAYQTNVGIYASHVSETSNTATRTEVTTPIQLHTSGIQALSIRFVTESFARSPDTLLPTTLTSSPNRSQVVLLSSFVVSASASLREVSSQSSSHSLVASPVSPLPSLATSSASASLLASLPESSKISASLATLQVPSSASFAPSPALVSGSLAETSPTSSESLTMASKSLLLSPPSVSLVTVCPKASSESSTVTADPASLPPGLSSSITVSSLFHLKLVSSSVSQSSLNSSNSSVFKQDNCVIYEYYNITKVLKPKRIFTLRLRQCRGKKQCNFNVTKERLGDPYKSKITSLRLFIKSSCQPASSGYLQWESWSACPDVCGVRYHQVRRRICLNPTKFIGGADCSGLRSETRPEGCYTPCLDRNSTTCDFMTANLSCPNGTFINIGTVFYGPDPGVNMTCNTTGASNGSCSASADMGSHNSAQVYERCQMRQNCTFLVSNDTFRDPCPGFTKRLKIEYTCSPVFKRTFCDEDKALISCPRELRLVFHNEPFYGQVNSSESCPASGPTPCISDLTYGGIKDFCNWHSCDITGVSGNKLGLTGQYQCKDTSSYLTVYHSCQKRNAVYTAWGTWQSCETCGLTNRRSRYRDCVDPGISYTPMGACSPGDKKEVEHCYHQCADIDISLNDGENITIVCPMYELYEKYHTAVIEIRSVFYGNGSCSSNNGSKIAVTKRCQGRRQCYLEASADIFNDSCPEIKKHLNVTYRCQPIYHMTQTEGYTMTPRDLHCYDDMVIVTHAVYWQRYSECDGNSQAMKIIQSLCDGRNSCYIEHSRSILGGSCWSNFVFTMYYSCQTAYGGLDTEWSSWSNCTECGHTPVKIRVKTCLSPVDKTSGAHCPLIQQIAPCNYPCPVSGLSFVSNNFSVVLGQNLSVLWKLSLGTNSTAVINWGDDSGNETVSQNILANATTPFFLTNEHNYTSEGDYAVRIYAFNFFSNQTIGKIAHIQVKLSGLNFTAPSAVATNTSSRFNVSLDVISLSKPNVSFLFGDGSAFSSNSFETNYSYLQAGLFTAKVIVANKVSMLTLTRQIIVQDLVEGFWVDRNVYLVAVGEKARFLFSIAQGTNVSVKATYYDCQLPFLTTWLSGPNNLDSLLTCVFDMVGVCNGLFYASNAVSQANASALIISEVAIHGFNVTIECLSEYPSCFQHDRILFNLSLTNGTLPRFVFNMGDGHTITSTNRILNYSFSSDGSFDVNITAYNNVSSKSVLHRLAVLALEPIVGVEVTCNKTVGLSDITVCFLAVPHGTAFQCWLYLDDSKQSKVYFVYSNLTSSWNYNYTRYGAYTVTFTCNNTITSSSAEFITKVVPRTLELSINHNGPVMVKNSLTLNLTASETGYPSCLTLDLGNSDKVVFGPLSCTPNDGGNYIENASFIYPLMLYNYSYSTAGVYNITWTGQNGFDRVSVNTTVVVTELPCRRPDVNLPNIASNPLTPTGITRSKEFTIRSRFAIDCERATGAILQWQIFKNETEKGFVLQKTKVTATWLLILLSNELEYGLYRIKLTLTLVNAFSITGIAEGYVKVTTSDLIVDIQEGSANERMYSRPVLINATASLDPDTLDRSGLEFRWYCYNITDRFADFSTSETPLSTLLDVLVENPLPDGCFNQNGTLPMNSSHIYLSRQKIIKNGIYVIKLVLMSGNREATKSTVIQMRDEEISHFHIRCKVNCKHMVITTDILSVTSRCVSGECSKANSTPPICWELFYRNVNETGLLNWIKVDDLESIALSNTSSKNLVLKANVLKPETSYVIRLRKRSFVYEGLSEYSFITSRPPHGGNCSVGPSEGKAFETIFTFACSGWKTKHFPLLYVFSYYDPYTQLKPLLFRAEEDRFSVKLAPGEPSGDKFQLTVFFSIIDSLGGRIDDQRSIKVLPRNFVQSELDDLVLNDNSKLDFYINIGDTDSVSELVSGVLSNLNYEATHLGNDSSVYELQKTVRYTVMEKISRIPISTLTDVNQVSTMIAAAAEVKEQVNSTAQQIATNKISSMISLLVNKSQDEVGVSVVTEGAVNLVSAVFNILMSASYNADFRRKDATNDADQEKSKEIAYRNMNNFDKVAEAIFNKQLPGQNDIEIQTKSAILTCRKARGTAIVEQPIKAGNASVKFPDITDLFGKRAVDVQLVYIPTNPFTWDKSSELVTTSILDVKVKEAQGARRVIDISNLADEIELEIPFEPLTPLSAPEVFFKQTDNESIQYHTVEVSETNGAMEFYVKPLEKQGQMTILVKYGAKPTMLEYDLQAKLPNFSSCSFEHDNCTENPHSIFLPSTYLNKEGTYYIGVKYEGTPTSEPNTHSRERRDCGEGGRSKRSANCIEYKNPPPTQPPNGKFAPNQQGYDKSKHSNYTMESLGLGCNYWNPSGNQFSGGGCRTGRRRTLSRTLSCRCKHLTSFGGGLLVKPNPIDFGKVWIAFGDIHNNMAVLATMISIFLFYLLVIIWARRADIRDRDSQKGIVVIGKPWNHNAYEATICTSKGRNSGTTAQVAFIIVGENGSSGVIPLSKLTKVKFSRGSVVTCTIYLPSSLGQLLYLHIWHDNTGDEPSWNLDHVVVRDTLSDERWSFMCGEWLAVESDDGKTEKVIYVANIGEMSNYKHLFLSNSADGFYDEHLWVSVAAKPPASSFTRVQRASCCLSILFSTMIANAMFYDDGKVDTSPVFYLGPIKISMRQLMIGIQSSLIIFPLNFGMTQLFRKSSSTTIPVTEKKSKNTLPKETMLPTTELSTFSGRFGQRPSSLKYLPLPYQLHITSSMSTIISGSESTFDFKTDDSKITNEKRKRYFYRFLYYLAWIVCFVSVFVSAFFTLMYSLEWGSERSQQWLLSFFVSFIQDATISQPVKVALFSALLAFVLKFSMEQREKHRRFKTRKAKTGDDDDEGSAHSTEVQLGDDIAGEDSLPLQQNVLQKAKMKRMKEIKSSEVMTDVLFYSLFLLLLLIVAYGHRAPIAYEMTNHLENIFPISAQHFSGILYWVLQGIAPAVFVGPWYNGMPPADSENGLLIDRNSVLVGMARLRQLRVLNDTCSNVPFIRYLARGCYGLYSFADEDTSLYKPEWVPVPPNIPIENISYDMCPRPWRYQTATELKGVPLWGMTTVYSGGGYVAELGYYPAKAQEVIEELAHHKWIDRRTRGVFVELTVYNPQVNLFSVISLLVETMPTGGVETFRRIDTTRVYRYIGELANVALAAELIIALVILFLLYKVIKRMYHQRLAFFKKFWNLVDLLQVLFALVSIALYFVKMISINTTMKDLSDNPFLFVSFSMLLTWNEIDTYMIAFVVFLTTIKFLYLLRFNSHIKLLNQTFSNMRQEILQFMVQFSFWFLPFVIMSHISFGAHLQDFISLPSAFQAMLNALLGASYFHDLEQVDRVIGPALFFCYSILMELILLNMFVSIINAAFESREEHLMPSETDPELIEFIMKRLKAILGVNLLSSRVGPEQKWFVDDSSEDENDYRIINTKNRYNVLNRKLAILHSKFRDVSILEEEEEDEDVLLEMMLIRHEQDSIGSSRSVCSGTTETSF